jgi:hypothetical protein
MRSDEPKLRNAVKSNPPYALNVLPESAIRFIAKEILARRIAKGNTTFEGAEWEEVFAKAIGASWAPSNVGLDDIVLGNCCWGAKTVKSGSHLSVSSVRLISGRNSLDYSFDESNVRALDPSEIGRRVLSIWNGRVDGVRSRFANARTVILLKGNDLLSGSIFVSELVRFDYRQYQWSWNKNRNLVGTDSDNSVRFTWQPHGSQFTIHEHVPAKRHSFRLVLPLEMPTIGTTEILDAVGFVDDWIVIG